MGKKKKTNVGITIQSHPQVQARKKPPESPFHILFVGDLIPQARMPSDWSDRAHIYADVNKETFADLLQHLAPRLSLDVPDFISHTKKAVEINLQFDDLKAFRPESIAGQVPVLARLFKVKNLVEGVKKGDVALSDFITRAEAAGLEPDLAQRFYDVLSAPHKPASPDTPLAGRPEVTSPDQDAGKLSSLLQMVDLGSGAPAGKKPDAMDALLTAISSDETGSTSRNGSTGGIEGSAADMVIADLTQMLGDQTNAILHHHEFQRLEASWRGLRFLVDRIDFRKGTGLSVLAAPREHLNSALVHQLLNLQPEVQQQLAATPVSVVIADYEFDASHGDIELLREIAETMSGVQVPLVASAGAGFFGLEDPSQIAGLPVVWQYFDRPEYVAWNSLRDQAVSAYVTLALPRFLLRFPYGPENPVKGFQFMESMGENATSFVWGSGGVAAATAMARSVAETGWPTRITGSDGGGRIENLPLWQPFTRGPKNRIPLDVSIPDDKLVELAGAGFLVLTCRANTDAAYIAFAPTIHRPERYEDADADDQARIHASLPCRLLTARVVQHLLRFERELPPGLSRPAMLEQLEKSLESLLTIGGARPPHGGIEVEMAGSIDAANRIPLKIRIVTPPELLGGEVSILLGFELNIG